MAVKLPELELPDQLQEAGLPWAEAWIRAFRDQSFFSVDEIGCHVHTPGDLPERKVSVSLYTGTQQMFIHHAKGWWFWRSDIWFENGGSEPQKGPPSWLLDKANAILEAEWARMFFPNENLEEAT